MSATPQLRRVDRMMPDEACREMLSRAFCARLATMGADGYPYCIPLLYAVIDGEVYMHNTSDRGHLRANVEHDSRVCLEVDEPGEIFDYGRFQCDISVAYRSIVLFGRIRVVQSRAEKQRFCEAMLSKYGNPDTGRPKGFFPRIDIITVYAMTIERLTGKVQPLPPPSEQWPAVDRTKTPNARP
jgi:uncharacterized protein